MLKRTSLYEKGVNPVLLLFNDRSVEQRFKQLYLAHTRLQMRIAVAVAVLLYALFSIMIAESTQSIPNNLLLLRILIVVPLAVAFIIFTYHPKYNNLAEPILATLLSIGGAAVLLFYIMSQHSGIVFYHYGLILVFMYIFTLIKLRFCWSAWISLAILLLYELVIIILYPFNAQLLFVNIFVVTGFFVSAIAGYYNELMMRNEFILKEEISTQKEMLDEVNISLEEEVQKRTLELLKANKALSKEKLKAESSERLKSAFLANISHEIRTPLTRIVGFSELLAKANINQEKRQKYSEVLEENANQLLTVINDIIELSNIQSDNISLSKTSFNLHLFLDEFSPFIADELKKQNKMDVVQFSIAKQWSYDSFSITTDQFRLRKVMMNLLQNAVKFTMEGEIQLSYRVRTDNYIEFSIRDTGIGIEDENQEFIFDYFRQGQEGANRNYGGMGVGLSISKGIVRSLGGKIWVNSSISSGSTFYFTVPLS